MKLNLFLDKQQLTNCSKFVDFNQPISPATCLDKTYWIDLLGYLCQFVLSKRPRGLRMQLGIVWNGYTFAYFNELRCVIFKQPEDLWSHLQIKKKKDQVLLLNIENI